MLERVIDTLDRVILVAMTSETTNDRCYSPPPLWKQMACSAMATRRDFLHERTGAEAKAVKADGGMAAFMATRKHDESWSCGVPALNSVGEAWMNHFSDIRLYLMAKNQRTSFGDRACDTVTQRTYVSSTAGMSAP